MLMKKELLLSPYGTCEEAFPTLGGIAVVEALGVDYAFICDCSHRARLHTFIAAFAWIGHEKL